MKKLILFLTLAFLALNLSCLRAIREENYNKVCQAWVGQDANELIRAWGYPQQIGDMPNGNKVYIYFYSSTVTTPAMTMPSTTTYQVYGRTIYQNNPSVVTLGGGTRNRSCTTNFEVNSAGRIVYYRFSGNRCGDLLSPPSTPQTRVIPQEPTKMTFQFHSFLTGDITNLVKTTKFSRTDKIYLHTTWTEIEGIHRVKVLWIRPDQEVQDTSLFTFEVPTGKKSYRTWAWLRFRSGLFENDKLIGPWKALLFLDDNFLEEYIFTVV